MEATTSEFLDDPVVTTVTTVTTVGEGKWIDDADFTVILGIILVAVLIVGLGAYIAFVFRVTYREHRRQKRLEEILKNMPVEFTAANETIRGVQDAPSYFNAGFDPYEGTNTHF